MLRVIKQPKNIRLKTFFIIVAGVRLVLQLLAIGDYRNNRSWWRVLAISKYQKTYKIRHG